jgi:Na+-transporting methylmalonyl-CoA/oxaloacetate decarboxylase gamma subunit
MMTRRKRISILVLIFLVLLLAIIWLIYMWLSRQAPEVVEEPVVEVEEVTDLIQTNPTISEQQLEEERETRVTAADVVSLSKTFVTRYGSYSNEADFANLVDVLPLMSESFAAETEAFIEDAVSPEEYYGVTTHTVTVTVEEEDDALGVATVRVSTQREEAIGSPQNVEVRYQDILLTFVKESASWRVDSATWL